MKRTCLQVNTIEDQRKLIGNQSSEAKLNTDEQNSYELNRRSPFGKICGTKCSKFHSFEQVFDKRILDPKDNQLVKSFVRMNSKLIIYFMLVAMGFAKIGHSQVENSVAFDSKYAFDKKNVMEASFYDSDKSLIKSISYTLFYQSQGVNYASLMSDNSMKVSTTTVYDLNNNCGLTRTELGDNNTPPYNSCVGFKFLSSEEYDTLHVTLTQETKKICGHNCKKYTFLNERMSGEIWSTSEVNLMNNLSVLKPSKINASYQIVPVEGFILELTMIQKRTQRKTVFSTKSISEPAKFSIDFAKESVNINPNRITFTNF